MIRIILWDVDGTLLNFREAERAAVKECFRRFGLGACTDAMVDRYSRINVRYWDRLERGEMTKPQILRGRFREFFAGEGIAFDGIDDFNAEYQVRLGDTICYNDDSLELVRRLRGRVGQYAVTNGTVTAQERKLIRSGLGALMDGVVISDRIGFQKPAAGFFDHVFMNLPPVDRREVLIVGDSLTSDIRGGEDAGILIGWYNPGGVPNDRGVRVDYEIADLRDVEEILDRT